MSTPIRQALCERCRATVHKVWDPKTRKRRWWCQFCADWTNPRKEKGTQ